MEIRNLNRGDYITFKYGEMPYFYYLTGKITSLSIPKKLKEKSVKNLDWKEKLDLKGHVTILSAEGKGMTLCLAQVINGCEKAKKNEVQKWHLMYRSYVAKLKKEVGRLQKTYAKAIHTSN